MLTSVCVCVCNTVHHPLSVGVGCLLLGGLFLYDVFWVRLDFHFLFQS